MKFHQKSRNSPEGWKHCSSTTFLPSKWVPLGGKVENSSFLLKILEFNEIPQFYWNRIFSHLSRFRVLSGVWRTDGLTDEDGTRIRRRPPGAEPLRHPDGKSSLSQHVSHFREFGGDLRPPLHSNDGTVRCYAGMIRGYGGMVQC